MDARNPATMYPNQKVASQHMIPFISLGEIPRFMWGECLWGKSSLQRDFGKASWAVEEYSTPFFPDGPQCVPSEYGMNNSPY